MRAFIASLLLIAVATLPLLAQSTPYPSTAVGPEKAGAQQAPGGQESYPIAGSHLLWRQNAELARLAAAHPELLATNALRKTAWSFSVGSTHSWYADDFTNSSRYAVSSTCKAIGAHCYVFVEDSSWTKGYINQAVVDSVVAAFDLRTPADPSKGIFGVDTQTFGNPPDVDGDPKIVILILDIRDGWSGSGGYVAGYFFSYNEFAVSPSTPTSNVAEIYFLDCHPASLTTAGGLQQGLSTTAHEFQHMIHFNADPYEITFVNEACSEVAEVVNGYSVYNQSYFTPEPNHYLFDWRGTSNTLVLNDYSRAARFLLYYRDQFGPGVFKPIVASALTGSNGIDAGLTSFGTTRRFTDILQDWFIANILDDTTVNAKYGYRYHPLTKVIGHTFVVPAVPSTVDTVKPLAADYLSFISGNDLHAKLTWSSPSVSVKAVEVGSGSKQVVNVTSGVEFHEAAFGTTYTAIHFVVMNTDPGANALVTYQATGPASTVELKYDNGTPTGYPHSVAGDTVAVWFNAVPGAFIDSVRVAVRHSGSMAAGIWEYSGATRPTPLGKPLATGLTLNAAHDPEIIPYPVPWPNWGTLNLTSLNLPADKAFAVAFVYGGDPLLQPRVLTHPTTPAPSQITSLSYLQAADGAGSANWYYFGSGDTVLTYLVRAYVSFRAVTALSIYPGDANNDGVVDMRDILPIGQYFGKTGPTRPSASLSWTPQSTTSFYSPVAATYADCDGNGTVNVNDVQAILANWASTHASSRTVPADMKSVCQDILRFIDAQGSMSAGMQQVRSYIVDYMRTTLGVPLEYALEQNWPNPFNPTTTIRFTVAENVDHARLRIMNMLGQVVWERDLGAVSAGPTSVLWDGRSVAGAPASSGVYVYELTAGPYRAAKRMTLIK